MTTADYFRRMIPTWRSQGVTSIYVSPWDYDELVAAGIVTANPTATTFSGRVRYRLTEYPDRAQQDVIGRQLG